MVVEATALLALGLVTGLRHAFEPDHVVAVSALLHRERSLHRAAWVGAAWGTGHTAMLTASVLAVSILRIPIANAYLPYLEVPVGLMLIGVGIWAVQGTVRSVRELSRHEHDGLEHFHVGNAFHPHAVGDVGSGPRGFALGVVHGFAGSGALLLLTAAVLPSPAAAIGYALIFGVGSTIGMAAVSFGLALPLLAARSRPGLFHALTGTSGLASVVLGVVILLRLTASF